MKTHSIQGNRPKFITNAERQAWLASRVQKSREIAQARLTRQHAEPADHETMQNEPSTPEKHQ